MTTDQPIKKQLHLNPYDYHKYLINEYVLKRPGDTRLLHQQDKSKWKTDKDVILQNMKFIWNEDEMPATWEERLARKYYDKLFKEYCICDLSRYKENKIANRFRMEKEIVTGKGQFICGETSCKEEAGLRTWEVNFAYVEAGERKNALVKIRLCATCSEKLNHHSKKREVKRLNRSKRKSGTSVPKSSDERVQEISLSVEKPTSTSQTDLEEEEFEEDAHSSSHQSKRPTDGESLWKNNNDAAIKQRDEEFDDYLADLLL